MIWNLILKVQVFFQVLILKMRTSLQRSKLKLKVALWKEESILIAAFAMIFSGLFGALLWPPPSMVTYSALIALTGVSGVEGVLIRSSMGAVGILAYLWPTRGNLKLAGYSSVFSCALLLMVSFLVVGNGITFGLWLLMMLICIPALTKATGIRRYSNKVTPQEEE